MTREDSGLDANVEKSVTFNISQFYGVSTFAVIFGTYFAVSVKVDSDECCIFKHLVYNNTLVSVTTLLVSDPCILLVVAKFTSKVKTMVKLVKLAVTCARFGSRTPSRTSLASPRTTCSKFTQTKKRELYGQR